MAQTFGFSEPAVKAFVRLPRTFLLDLPSRVVRREVSVDLSDPDAMYRVLAMHAYLSSLRPAALRGSDYAELIEAYAEMLKSAASGTFRAAAERVNARRRASLRREADMGDQAWNYPRREGDKITAETGEFPPGYRFYTAFGASELPNEFVTLDDLERLGIDIIDGRAVL